MPQSSQAEGDQAPTPLHSSLGPPHRAATHHDLDFSLADLQVVLVIDVHPLQGTFHPIARPHQEHDCKATYGRHKITCLLTRNLLVFAPNPVPARGVPQEEGGH